MNTRNRLILANLAAQAAGKFPETLLALVTLPVLTRYLTVEDFGIYSFSMAFVALFAPLCDMGMTPILTREYAKNRSSGAALVGGVGVIRIYLVGISLAIVAAAGFFTARDKLVYILISSAHFLIYPLVSIGSVFYVELRTWYLSAAGNVKKLLFLAGLLAVRYAGAGLAWVMASYAFAEAATGILTYAAGRQFVKPVYRISASRAFFLIKEALPLFAVVVLGMLYTKVDTIMLSGMISYAEAGRYNGALQFYNFLIFIPAAISSVTFPILSERFTLGIRPAARAASKALALSVVSGLVVSAVGAGVCGYLIPLILSSAYVSSAPIFRILMTGLPFAFGNIIFGNIFVAGGKQKKILAVAAANFIVNIIMNLFLIPRYSALGAAAATSITQMSAFIVSGALAIRWLKPELNALRAPSDGSPS